MSKEPKEGQATLYHRLYWSSSPVYQVVEALGLGSEVAVVELDEPELREEWFLKLNPLGKIPTFVDSDGKVTRESLAMALQILDKYDKDFELIGPPGSSDRYKCIEVCCFCIAHLYPQLDVMFAPGIGEEHKMYTRELTETKLLEHVEYLLRDGRKWVMGDKVSLADFFLGYELMGFKFVNPPLMEGKSEIVKAYNERFASLPSSKKVYSL